MFASFCANALEKKYLNNIVMPNWLSCSGYDFEETYVQEIEEPTKQVVDKVKKRSGKEQGVLPGFKVASNSDYQLER